jgi:hypothetical protein
LGSTRELRKNLVMYMYVYYRDIKKLKYNIKVFTKKNRVYTKKYNREALVEFRLSNNIRI